MRLGPKRRDCSLKVVQVISRETRPSFLNSRLELASSVLLHSVSLASFGPDHLVGFLRLSTWVVSHPSLGQQSSRSGWLRLQNTYLVPSGLRYSPKEGSVSTKDRGGEWFHPAGLLTAEFWDREQPQLLTQDMLGLGKLSCELEGHLSAYKKWK